MAFTPNIRSHNQPSPEEGLLVHDFHGACWNKFRLPLRRRPIWSTARKVELHSDGPVPAGFVLPSDPLERPTALLRDTHLERVIVRCGKCPACVWRRRKMWESAAIGFYRTSDLTIFGTLTFSPDWFRKTWERKVAANDAAMRRLVSAKGMEAVPEDYDSSNPDHFYIAREWLKDERTRWMKRLRYYLGAGPLFEGVELVAHVQLMEMGDLRGRLHWHFLMFFDGIGRGTFTKLVQMMKDQWFAEGNGVGYLDAKRADAESGKTGCQYIFKYIGKYVGSGAERKYAASETRIASSLGFLAEGRRRYADTIPSGECPPDDGAEGEMETVTEYKDSELDARLEGLTPVDDGIGEQAAYLALMREYWNAGELWPLLDAGEHMPEDRWRDLPPSDDDWSNWLRAYYGPGQSPFSGDRYDE